MRNPAGFMRERLRLDRIGPASPSRSWKSRGVGYKWCILSIPLLHGLSALRPEQRAAAVETLQMHPNKSAMPTVSAIRRVLEIRRGWKSYTQNQNRLKAQMVGYKMNITLPLWDQDSRK